MSRIQKTSLRRQLVGGATAFSVLAAGGALTLLYFTDAMQDELRGSTRTVLEDQRIAEQLVLDVYRQLLDAVQYLQDPSQSAALESFRDRSDQVYDGVRSYLFRELTVAERLQVEHIKERHEELEVAAHHAFDLARQGRGDDVLAHRENLFAQLPALESAVDSLVAMRLASRAALLERQTDMLNRLLLGTGLLALALLGGVVALVRLLQRRMLVPLQQLSEAAARLGAGDYAVRVSLARDDEFAMLAARFNEMAANLDAARSALQDRNLELERAYAELHRSQDQLMVSEKMAALGRLTGGIAHEINSPLGAILNALELARGYVDEYRASAADPDVTPADHRAIAADLEETLQAAQAASEKVAQFVRTIKGQTRSEHHREVSFAAAAEVESTLAVLTHEFRRRALRPRLELDRNLRILGDPGQFALVVQNLVTNAIDASADGGEVFVRLQRSEGELILEVEDRGTGISEHVRPRIFDYLFTTKDVGKGTGLGLTTVHNIVTGHFGGVIEVESAPGEGATFRVRLPARTAPVHVSG